MIDGPANIIPGSVLLIKKLGLLANFFRWIFSRPYDNIAVYLGAGLVLEGAPAGTRVVRLSKYLNCGKYFVEVVKSTDIQYLGDAYANLESRHF